MENTEIKKQKKDTNSLKYIYLSLLPILIIFIISLILIIYYKPSLSENTEAAQPNNISNNYFQPLPQFEDQNPLSSSTSFTSTSSPNNLQISTLLTNGYTLNNIDNSLNQLGQCQVYTFENNYNIPIKPSLNNLGGAINSNFAHLENDVFCLSNDQIQARQNSRVCEGNNCLSQGGNKLSKNTLEIYPTNCSSDLPICDGGMYNICMNFTQGDRGIIGTSTRCLTVENVNIPTAIYNQLDDFYKDSGIFTPSSTLDSNLSTYTTTISSQLLEPGNYKQKFRIARYTWNGKEFFADDNGFFAEIIFRPLNLRLAVNENNFDIVFNRKTDNNPDPNWLLMPPLNLSPQNLTKIQRGNMCQDLTTLNSKATAFSGYNVEIEANGGLSVKIEGRNQVAFPDINTGLYPSILPAKKGLEVIDTSYTWSTNPNTFRFTAKWLVNFPGTGNEPPTRIPNPNFPSIWDNVNNNELSDVPNIADVTDKYVVLSPGTPNNTSTFYRNISTSEEKPITDRKDFTEYKFNINANGNTRADNFLSTYSLLDNNNIIIDGDVVWQKKNKYDNIAIFSDGYYFDKNVNEYPFKVGFKFSVAPGSSFSAGSGISYLTPKTGLLSSIDYSNVTYTNNEGTSAKSYTVNASSVPGLGGTGKFVLNLTPPVVVPQGKGDESKITISSYSIIDSGSGSTNAKDVDITVGGNLTISGLSFTTTDQEVFYVGVPDGEAGGLVIKDVSLNTDNSLILEATVENGGYGYKVFTPGESGSTVRIVQIDSDENILTPGLCAGVQTLDQLINDPVQIDKLNLAYISSNMLDETPLPFYQKPAPINLMKTGYRTGYTNIQYNYFTGSTGTYNKSPPQIAYMDSKSLEIFSKVLVNSTDPTVLEKLFKNSTSNDPPITPYNYIKVLQYATLNYSNTKDDFSLNGSDELVLGRFIPYSSWVTPINGNDYGGGNSQTITLKNGDKIITNDNTRQPLYNNNYVQLIPYGIEHIYERTIAQSDLPTF